MKKALKIICFIAVFVMLYLYLGFVLLPKDIHDSGGEKYYSAIAYRDEPKNTLDVMFFGNSDLYNGVSPMEIYQNTGIRSFGCGVAHQTTSSAYDQIKGSIQRQRLQLAVIEADFFYQPNKKFLGSRMYDYALLIAPFFYHSRWKELSWKDFFSAPNLKGKDNYMKGYIYSDVVKKYELKPNYMADKNAPPKNIEKSILRDFDKIYNLCKKNGVKLMLVTVPSPISWSNEKSNGIQRLCDEYNEKDGDYFINYYDMNLGLDGFDYATHFRDNGDHCNVHGAKVVSKALGKYLKDKYDLPDYSNDAKWQTSLQKYHKRIQKKPKDNAPFVA